MIRLLASVGSFEPVGARNEQEHLLFFSVPDLLCVHVEGKAPCGLLFAQPVRVHAIFPGFFFFLFSCWVVKDHVRGSHAHLVWFPPPFFSCFEATLLVNSFWLSWPGLKRVSGVGWQFLAPCRSGGWTLFFCFSLLITTRTDTFPKAWPCTLLPRFGMHAYILCAVI